ncbi:MAG: metal ABC transporter substrate-binding protein [Planctomycetota bacterium]
MGGTHVSAGGTGLPGFGLLKVIVVTLAVGFVLGLGLGALTRDGSDEPRIVLTGGATQSVVVSIPPLKSLVEALADEAVPVSVLVPSGTTVHGWSPTPEDARSVLTSGLMVTVGLGLEGGLSDLLAQRARVGRPHFQFATAVGIVSGTGHDDHEHEGHDHAHGPVDPHLWLDPALVERLIPELARALVDARLADRALIDSRISTLRATISDVDIAYRSRLAPLSGKGAVVDHNAYTRLFSRYGLRQAGVVRPIETAEPTPEQIRRVVEAIESGDASALLVEPQFSGGAARRVAELTDVRVGRIDPLGSGDWTAMMLSNLDALVGVLSPSDETE